VDKSHDLGQSNIPDSPLGLRPLPKYHVIVHNCDCHDQVTVSMALQNYIGMDAHTSYEKMMAIHMLGKTIVATAHHEAAEHYKNLLEHRAPNQFGWGLNVTLEPAE
jgi:ATP-dependent Clp protease adapter protein ClpS